MPSETNMNEKALVNKAESLLDANIAKSVVSSLLILTDDWGV